MTLLHYSSKLSVPDSGNKRCYGICTRFKQTHTFIYAVRRAYYTTVSQLCVYVQKCVIMIGKLHTDCAGR